jgi:hypothetical protein
MRQSAPLPEAELRDACRFELTPARRVILRPTRTATPERLLVVANVESAHRQDPVTTIRRPRGGAGIHWHVVNQLASATVVDEATPWSVLMRFVIPMAII